MEYLQKLRTTHPNTLLETRKLAFPDSIDRLITLEPWHWEKLALITDKGSRGESEVIAFCFDLACESHKKFNKTLQQSFYEHFAYYIDRAYQSYVQYRNGWSNDNYRPTTQD